MHMSYVICHMSYVICHMSYVIYCLNQLREYNNMGWNINSDNSEFASAVDENELSDPRLQ